MTKFLFAALLPFIFVFQAQGKERAVDTAAVERFAKLSSQTGKPKVFLKPYKNDIAEEDYAYLSTQIETSKVPVMPIVTLKTPTSLQFDFQGHSLVVTYLPDHKIQVNGKILDLEAAGTIDKQLELVVHALPQYGKSALFDVMIGRAYADSESRLGGPALIGVGAAFLAAEPVGAVIAGVAIVASGIYVWQSGICDEIIADNISCLDELKVMDAKLNRKTAAAKAAAAGKPRPMCRKESKEDEAISKAHESLREFAGNQQQHIKKLSWCFGPKKKVYSCIQQLSLDMYYLCDDMHGFLDDYLPPYARDGSKETARPHFQMNGTTN